MNIYHPFRALIAGVALNIVAVVPGFAFDSGSELGLVAIPGTIIQEAVPGFAFDSGNELGLVATPDTIIQEAAFDWQVTGGTNTVVPPQDAVDAGPFRMADFDWRVVGSSAPF